MKRKALDGSSATDSSLRVVAHLDMDCFYVQAERSKDSSLIGKPVAVVQYNPFGDLRDKKIDDYRIVGNGSLIAVSYEARAKGVKRNMRGAEAKKVCPDIVLVQVPTCHGKADLTIYRDASAKILKVLAKSCGLSVIERASIDEVYVDVTEAAKQMEKCFPSTLDNNSTLSFNSEPEESVRNSTEEWYSPLLEGCSTTVESLAKLVSYVLDQPTLIAGDDKEELLLSKSQLSKGHAGSSASDAVNGESDTLNWLRRPWHEWSPQDRLLLFGAATVAYMRKAVRTELGFTMSAGIAHNKMLAKLSSGMHKPNKQTIVPSVVVPDLMATLPFSRIQGFGGKLGIALSELSNGEWKTLGDLLTKARRQTLVERFGDDTAQWMLEKASGIDLEPVKDRALPISIGCSKSFRSSNILSGANVYDGIVLKWLCELAEELYERVETDTAYNSRIPKSLTVVFSLVLKENSSTTSNGIPIENRIQQWHDGQGIHLSKVGPYSKKNGPVGIANQALNMLTRAVTERLESDSKIFSMKYSITSLGLSATSFTDLATGNNTIMNFLMSKPVENQENLMNGLSGAEHINNNSSSSVTFNHTQVPSPTVEVKSNKSTDSNSKASIANYFSTSLNHRTIEDEEVVFISPAKSVTSVNDSSTHTACSESGNDCARGLNSIVGGFYSDKTLSSSLNIDTSSTNRDVVPESFGDISAEVFMSLPADIKRELQLAYRSNPNDNLSKKKAKFDESKLKRDRSSNKNVNKSLLWWK